MKKIISGKRIIFTVMFLAISAGLFIISFSFTGGRDFSPQSGGWQLQTSMQTLLNGRVITDMTFLDSLTGFAVTNARTNGDTSFIFKTTNAGNNWIVSYRVTDPVDYNNFKKIMFTGDSVGYACGGGGFAYLCKTTNKGSTWIQTNYLWAAEFDGMYILRKDTIYMVDHDALVGGVFRSTDGGQSWQRIYFGAQYNPQNIYMVNSQIGFYSQGNTYKTTDGGFSWSFLDNVGFFYAKFIDVNTGFRLNSIGIQKTNNCGINWTTYTLPHVPGTTSGISINNLSFIGTDTIWASGTTAEYPNPLRYFGVLYKTTNGGLNWGYQIPDTSAIHIPRYYYVNFSSAKHGWAYHTLGQGIHTTVGGDSTIIVGVNQTTVIIPQDFSLEQNYPNPFNSISKIKYQISKISNIKIGIFDITGKEIYTAVDQMQRAGVYEVSFDGSYLSSGIYFYSLFTDGKKIDTKKMILLK